jgi:hypothetical protein
VALEEMGIYLYGATCVVATVIHLMLTGSSWLSFMIFSRCNFGLCDQPAVQENLFE